MSLKSGRWMHWPSPASDTGWLASSAALPASMTFARTGAALRLWHSSSYASAAYESISENNPRFDRLPGDEVGLLIEGARTQILRHSRDLTQAVWVPTAATVTDADTVSLNAFGGLLEQNNTHTVGDKTWTISARVKSSVFTSIRLKCTHQGVSDYFSGGLAVSSAWGFVAFTQAFGSGGTGTFAGPADPGNGENGALDVDGLMLEEAAFRSSLVATSSTSGIARNAETTSKTVSPGSSWAAVFKIRTAPGRSGDQFIACWHDGTANERIDLYLNSSGAVRLTVVDGGSTVADITGGTIAVSTTAKVAISIAANSIGLAVAGTAATRDTSNTIPTVTTMCFGHDRSGANHLFGHLIEGPSGITWLTAKNDSELEALTS